MTIIVHHLNNSRSQRILWLLEELGEPYDVRRYERPPRCAPFTRSAAPRWWRSTVIA